MSISGKIFHVKNVWGFFNAQENDSENMIELINQASNGALQPLG